MTMMLDAPTGTACVVLIGEASVLARGRMAEFRQRGITLVPRPTAVTGLLELSKQPDGVLLVPSDLDDMALCDVLDLAGAIAKAPVILGLSANVTAETVAQALDHGARGTIPLPVTPARLGTILQTIEPRQDASVALDVGSLHLVPGRYSVTWMDVEVDLTPREFEVLVALMKAHPRALSLSELIDIVGITGNDRENSLRVVVNRVRMHLEHACPGYSAPIDTVRGVGYRLSEFARSQGRDRDAEPLGDQ